MEARHGLTVKSRDQWLDLWLANPAYLEMDDWPIGWLIEDGKGRVVGSLGNIPSFCHFGGRQFVCASGRGWAVDVPYRAYSVALLAHQVRQNNSDVNVIATPSATTAALCTQLGWSRVPVGTWNRSEFWITDYREVLRAYLKAKAPTVVYGLARAMVASSSQPRDVRKQSASDLTSRYQLDWCSAFDERFDDFWDKLKEARPELLLSTRDTKTLRWHFKHSLQQGHIWILTADLGGSLAAYAILEQREIRSLNLARVLFVDFQTISQDSALASAMIQFAGERCRREGIHILENAGCWLKALQPVPAPPYHRSLGAWCYLYRTTNPELEKQLRSRSSWYPTQYDGDASL